MKMNAEAETMLLEVLAALQRELGTQHPDTVATGNNLAQLLSAQRKRERWRRPRYRASDIERVE